MATEITNLGAYLAAGRRAQGAEGVCLHHSASPTAAQYKGAATIDGIRKYHMQTNGWRDIGYHFHPFYRQLKKFFNELLLAFFSYLSYSYNFIFPYHFNHLLFMNC